jgi:hypothetical protein
MANTPSPLVVFLAFLSFINGQSVLKESMTNLKASKAIFKVHETIEHIKNVSSMMLERHPDPEKDVLNMFKQIDDQISELEDQVANSNIWTIMTMIGNEPIEHVQVRDDWQSLKRTISEVGLFYHHLRQYIRNEVYFDEVIINDFIKGQRPKSLAGLQNLHKFTVSANRADSLLYKLYMTLWYQVVVYFVNFSAVARGRACDFVYIVSCCACAFVYIVSCCTRMRILGIKTITQFIFQDGKQLCSLGQTPHQIIYNLYNVIALTEIKGYAMIQFSYMILRLYDQGNFTIGI